RQLRHRRARGCRWRRSGRPGARALQAGLRPRRRPPRPYPDARLHDARRARGPHGPGLLRLPGVLMTQTCPYSSHDTNDALTRWGDYDRDDPFPLFEDVRAAGPVHDVTLADGHRAFLVVGYAAAREALNHPDLS